MAGQVVNFFGLVFSSVTSWFEKIFSATGMWNFFFVFFVILSVTRILVVPLLSGRMRGSDTARKSQEKDDE